MLRVSFEEMKQEFKRVLLKKGFDEEKAEMGAQLFTETSCDGIYSHGVNRFPRVMEYIEKGYIDVNADPIAVGKMGAFERWDGKLGLGNINAKKAMDRAIELAKEYGIGCVAIQNTNHWLRGGSYGWQAADAGCIGLCWTNTQPNMPAWGASERRIGNNPLIFAIPREEGHIVADLAMAQFSYGQMEATKLRGEQLPVPGGYDAQGNITTDPAEIEKTWRVLPIGFWKGSGLSILLDLIAASLSGGNSCKGVGELGSDEYGLSQVLIAIDAHGISGKEYMDKMLGENLEYIKTSEPVTPEGKIFYPGELELLKRKENLEQGIPVHEDIWARIQNM